MKVLLIIFLPMLFLSCSKKNEVSYEQQSNEGSTGESIIEKDTAQTSVEIKDTVVVLLSYEQLRGKYIFAKYCAVCHGEEGKGNGFNSYNLNPRPRSFTDSTYISTYTYGRLYESISKGGRGFNISPLMPSYHGTLSNLEIEYVTKYVRFLSTKKH